MLKATKKNRQLKISEDKAKIYEDLGYTITDEEGKVIYKPRDVEAELKDAKAEIEKLNAEIAELKKAAEKPAAKKSTAKKAEVTEEAVEGSEEG